MMPKSRASADYVCPICVGLQGGDKPATLIEPTDFVYRDELVSALINTFFYGQNAGHVIVVPNKHFENLYTLPPEYGHRVFDVAQKVALAMKQAYKCDGITTRQNNEPAGDQHGMHFHLHVTPRYDNDTYNTIRPKDKRLASAKERASYAAKLKPYL